MAGSDRDQSERPRKLGDVLEALVDRMGIRSDLDEAKIVEAWAALAGADVNAATDGAWLRRKTLFVKVTRPALRQDLHLDRSNWCRRLNERLGTERVEEIVFR